MKGGETMKRYRMSKSKSRRSFRRSSGTHKRNLNTNPMRGGIRI